MLNQTVRDRHKQPANAQKQSDWDSRGKGCCEVEFPLDLSVANYLEHRK